MTGRRRSRLKPLQKCAYCAKPIAEQRPPVLLSPVGGHIVGPFHAGCAERIVLLSRKAPVDLAGLPAKPYGRLPREGAETL